MDPITIAILAAIAAGVSESLATATIQQAGRAYSDLKKRLRDRFGQDSDLAKAIDGVEKNPDSKGRQLTLAEEIHAVKADEDAELVQMASILMGLIKDFPGGQQTITNVTASGDRSIAVGGSAENSTFITGDRKNGDEETEDD